MPSNDDRYAYAGSRAIFEWRTHYLRGPYPTSSISGGQRTAARLRPRTTSSISRGRPVPSESHERDAFCLRFDRVGRIDRFEVGLVGLIGLVGKLVSKFDISHRAVTIR